MPVFIEIFLMLCVIAQSCVCGRVQPPSMQVKIPAESATEDHTSTIYSVISNAGNCTAYKNFTLDPKFLQLEKYCGRPLPDTPRADEFLSYEVILCMVLYDAVQRVCKAGREEVTKEIQNVSGDFSCDNMIKGVTEASTENLKLWVTLFEAQLGSISGCERECIQNKTISPVCEYIWKTNTAGISPSENLKVNSKDHGKTNKTMTSKDKPLETKTSNQSSAAGPSLSILNSESKKTEQVDHTMTPISISTVHKEVDPAEANGNSTQSGSANDVKNVVKEQAHTKDGIVQNDSKQQAKATVNTGHSDAKEQAHTADSNTQNDINKETHVTNSNVQNIMTKQGNATNSSIKSAEITPHNAPVSLSVHTEHTPETGKYDGGTGKSISSDSKSNTEPQTENKSSDGVYTSDRNVENQKDNNEDEYMPTDENAVTFQATGVEGGGDEDQEEDRKIAGHEEEQSGHTPEETETHQEETETGNTAQFNQLGDAADSHFYAYFMTMVVICIIGYLVFHNKQKILALALEGRSRRGTRRRPNTSAYRKLDSNLEEAVTSTGSTSVTHVIY